MHIFELSIFGFHIAPTWYGLMYAIGFFLCYKYIEKCGHIEKRHMDSLLFFIFLGVIGGGRLGYALFYQPEYFFYHPVEIFYVWNGGMSFHGGLVGVIIAILMFARKYKYKIFEVSDPLTAIIPIALGLGRIGNYINKELLGFPHYTGPFGIEIDSIRYFPSPLFQAILEGVVLFIVVQLAYKIQKKGNISGLTSIVFLIGYGALRIVSEFFRIPDSHIGYLFDTNWITLGMIYSLPMIFLGLFLINQLKKRIYDSKY